MNDRSEPPLPVRPVMARPPWPRGRRRHGAVLGVICGLCLIGAILKPGRIRIEHAEWPDGALEPSGLSHYYFGWPWEQEQWWPNPWALIFGGVVLVGVFLPNPVRALCLLSVGLVLGFVLPLWGSISIARMAVPEMVDPMWPGWRLYAHFAGISVLPLAALTQGGLLAFLRHPRPRESRRVVLLPAIAATAVLAGLVVLRAAFGALRWPPNFGGLDVDALAEMDATAAMFLNIGGCACVLLAAGLLLGVLAGGLRKRWLARIALGIGLAALALESMAGAAASVRIPMLVIRDGVVHGWPAYYASHLFNLILALATIGLIIVGYAGLWLLDPKRERKESVR